MILPVPVPVTVLSGFLGAGMTTLLNHVLAGQGSLDRTDELDESHEHAAVSR